MYKISEWKLAQKLQASKHRGLIIGLTIGVLVCLMIVGAIIKICWLKKKFGCLHYEIDGEFSEDLCECDENGCSYTSDKDFV